MLEAAEIRKCVRIKSLIPSTTELVNQASAAKLIGPEKFYGISHRLIMQIISTWSQKEQKRGWRSILKYNKETLTSELFKQIASVPPLLVMSNI